MIIKTSKKISELFLNNSKPSDKSSTQKASLSLNECFQIEFNSFMRNIVFLAYPKEIFIFDLVIHQTVGYIQLDKTTSPYTQVAFFFVVYRIMISENSKLI